MSNIWGEKVDILNLSVCGKICSIQVHDDENNATNQKEDIIIIYCQKLKIYLKAFGDCCSYSVFEDTEDINSIIGKKIEFIDENLADVDQNGEEKTYEICIGFTDKSEYKFNMVNYSNGYYSGWLDVKVYDDKKIRYHPSDCKLDQYIDKFSDIAID